MMENPFRYGGIVTGPYFGEWIFAQKSATAGVIWFFHYSITPILQLLKNERSGKMRSSKPILLVEDDQVDAMTVERALKDIRVTNRLDIVGNGEEALSLLRNPEWVFHN
jgi:hypothetical protein